PLHRTATTQISTLSLHDALPISVNHDPDNKVPSSAQPSHAPQRSRQPKNALDDLPAHHSDDYRERQLPVGQSIHIDPSADPTRQDRKSTRLNSSHVKISYAVFCL